MSLEIGILGAGGWGTALAKILCEKGHRTTLWCRGEETYKAIREKGENPFYLPAIRLPNELQVSLDIAKPASAEDLIFCAVPSHGVHEVMRAAAGYLGEKVILVCGTKGIDDELKTMAQVFSEECPGTRERTAFLSGPTFALEVAAGLPAAVTVAAEQEGVARRVQDALSTAALRVYVSDDVVGVQMGGVVKNVIAIASGVSDGLSLGQNARAALITRGLAEMTRLAVALGANPRTLTGLPGLGDLVLTCTGKQSRNRKVGLEIAAGRKVEEIVESMKMVAEGVKNTKSVYRLAERLGVEMPIVEQMYRVLYEGKDPGAAVRDLMQRALKAEAP